MGLQIFVCFVIYSHVPIVYIVYALAKAYELRMSRTIKELLSLFWTTTRNILEKIFILNYSVWATSTHYEGQT